ncbi:MAG TPA: metalloprotease TldD [Nitrospiria bacterium]|jgi:TldD protein|nr:metalloprotease TldD [Nitrospiria bacterium]
MRQQLVKSESFFLDRFGVTPHHVEHTIGRVLGGAVDYADLYFEYRILESVSLEERMVKHASKNVTQGVGVRAIAREKTGYAFSHDITLEDLELAAGTARYIADHSGREVSVGIDGFKRPNRDLYPLRTPVTEIPVSEKIALLNQIDIIGRQHDPRIKHVLANLTSEYKVVLIATSGGMVIGDIQPLTRLSVTCIAEERGNRQTGTFGGGGRVEFSYFFDRDQYRYYTVEAARRAILNLSAVNAPAGMMTVVLGPGWPGILLHEAIGHGLEGDFNRKGVSAFTGRIGQKVASELCTIVDDGTLPFRRGSLNIDDEGTPTSRTVLIEKGILRGYLQDRLNSRLMKMPLTGNGRRESFAYAPMPRMTNTFMMAGESTPEEIIRSVKSGLYAVAFGGGQVDITSGKFVFSASEAYLIEEGRLTNPVKGATLIGNGPDILTRVSMVGSDLKLDEGIGTCGKEGQTVPVGVGLPTLRIDGITVGGTQ